MKRVFLILLCLALPLSAKGPHRPTVPVVPLFDPTPADPIRPTPVLIPDSELDKIPPEEIEATKLHRDSLVKEAEGHADAANARADAANARADASQASTAIALSNEAGTLKSLATTQGQLTTIQTEVNKKDDKIAKDAEKIARFGKLVIYLALILASVAALYVWEMLKPTGILGKLLSATGPAIQYGAPVVVWLATFSAVEVYLKYVL